MYIFVTLTVSLNCRTNDGIEMQSSMQNSTIHKNPSAEKDVTELEETAMSDHVIYCTINSQPQEQNAELHENPSGKVQQVGISNPMYSVQLRAIENHYSFDSSTENIPTYCTADYVQ